MKSLLMILLLNSAMSTNTVDELRDLLYASYHDSKAAERLGVKTEAVGPDDSPILVGYKGMAEMMKCRYANFPIEKWLLFNRGKKYLELAIQKEPYNAELRFFRLTVQVNTPAILCYKSNITKDKQMLLDYLSRKGSNRDSAIYHSVKRYMAEAGICTKEEKMFLNNLH